MINFDAYWSEHSGALCFFFPLINCHWIWIFLRYCFTLQIWNRWKWSIQNWVRHSVETDFSYDKRYHVSSRTVLFDTDEVGSFCSRLDYFESVHRSWVRIVEILLIPFNLLSPVGTVTNRPVTSTRRRSLMRHCSLRINKCSYLEGSMYRSRTSRITHVKESSLEITSIALEGNRIDVEVISSSVPDRLINSFFFFHTFVAILLIFWSIARRRLRGCEDIQICPPILSRNPFLNWSSVYERRPLIISVNIDNHVSSRWYSSASLVFFMSSSLLDSSSVDSSDIISPENVALMRYCPSFFF